MTTPFVHGGISFPLVSPPTGGRTMLRDADPAVFFLLDYFAWCIRKYVGARLLHEATAAGLAWTDSVQSTVPYDPRPYLREQQQAFPMLGVYRVNSTMADLTMSKRRDASQLEVVYVLPPLAPSQMERVGPVLNAVKALFDHTSEAGWDAAYTPPGGTAGDTLFASELAGLSDIETTAARFGAYTGTDELTFPAVVLTVQTLEASELNESDLPELSGAGIYVDNSNGDGSLYPDTSGGKVGPVPEVDSVSPAIGPKAGGTEVTLLGDYFEFGVEVLFDGQLAELKDFDVNELVVVTPPAHPRSAHFTNYPVDIVVRLPSGQLTELPASYTYAD